MNKKKCVLVTNKFCDSCGQCLICDLDPNKICDNCCKCLDPHAESDYAVIEIDRIVTDDSELNDTNPEQKNKNKGKRYQFRWK